MENLSGRGIRASWIAVSESGDTIFLCSDALHLQAISASSGHEVWTFPAACQQSTPTVGRNGLVYVASTDASVYAISGTTGKPVWKYDTKSSFGFASTPALGPGGNLFIGSLDTKLYALNGSDGSLLWSFPTGGPINSSVAIGGDGTVYVGSSDKFVYALDGHSGKCLWSTAMDSWVGSSLALSANGVLYVYTGSGTLFALASGPGTVMYRRHSPGSTTDWSSPAIGASGVYVASFTSGQLLAYADAVPLVTPSSKPSASSGPAKVPTRTFSVFTVLGIVGGVVLVVLGVATPVWCICRRQKVRRAALEQLLAQGINWHDETARIKLRLLYVLPAWTVRVDDIVLGRGSFGNVKQAWYLGEEVCVKVSDIVRLFEMPVNGTEHQRAVSNFDREVDTLIMLRHPNVLRIRGVVVNENSGVQNLIVMERAQCNLKEHLNDFSRKLPLPDFVRICADLARGLSYLHYSRVIHRDLKPANILVFVDPQTGMITFKIGDVGIARSMDTMSADGSAGTPFYRAPEVTGTYRYQSSADVWSLGVIMVEVVVLYMGPTRQKENRGKVRELEEEACAWLTQNGGEALARVIAGCLQEKEEDRPTAAAVSAAVEAVLDTLPPEPVTALPPQLDGSENSCCVCCRTRK